MLKLAPACLLLAASALVAQSAATAPTIQATGSATLSAPPDQVQLTAGVVTQASTAQDAAQQNALQTTAVIGAIQQVLGSSGTVQTTGYSVTPRYNNANPAAIVGYTASNALLVTILDLTSASGLPGKVIDAANQARRQQYQRPDFRLAEPRSATAPGAGAGGPAGPGARDLDRFGAEREDRRSGFGAGRRLGDAGRGGGSVRFQHAHRDRHGFGQRQRHGRGADDTIGGMGTREIATLAGGCFWCLEAVFKSCGACCRWNRGTWGAGRAAYQKPSRAGTTGHAEAVRVTFDPAAIAIREILEVFFAIHDPTTLESPGQRYRDAIPVGDLLPGRGAATDGRATIRELDAQKVWPDPIVTEVVQAGMFYRAEDYHQEYFRNNPQQPYCAYVVAPKVQKFRRKFAAKIRR